MKILNIFKEKVLKLLENYFDNIGQRNIPKLQIGLQNVLILDNLQFKEDLLFKNNIPLMISKSNIGRITINIPINIMEKQVKIFIENMEIYLSGFDNQMFQHDERKQQMKNKKCKIKQLEDQYRKIFEDLQSSWSIQRIFKNVNISISNVIINFISDLIGSHQSRFYVRAENIEINQMINQNEHQSNIVFQKLSLGLDNTKFQTNQREFYENHIR